MTSLTLKQNLVSALNSIQLQIGRPDETRAIADAVETMIQSAVNEHALAPVWEVDKDAHQQQISKALLKAFPAISDDGRIFLASAISHPSTSHIIHKSDEKQMEKGDELLIRVKVLSIVSVDNIPHIYVQAKTDDDQLFNFYVDRESIAKVG